MWLTNSTVAFTIVFVFGPTRYTNAVLVIVVVVVVVVVVVAKFSKP